MGWFMCLCLLIFFLHSQFHFSSSSSSNSSSPQLCRHDQSVALLQFKKTFSFDPFASSHYCDKPYPKMKSWKEGIDCCSWDGVTCDRTTGHVIGLDLNCSGLKGLIRSNSTLSLLPHLQFLNLAFNDFNMSPISSMFGGLESLTHLNLSTSRFSGHIASEISHLSKLVSLDLSQNDDCQLEPLSLNRLVRNLTDLRELFLNDVNMSSIEPSSLMNLSSSLTSLGLSGCELHGEFPGNIFHLPNLQLLSLNDNIHLTGYLPRVNWSGPLESLELPFTSFLGEVSDSIGNLKFLNYLDLCNCEFLGTVPESLGNLTQITYLNLYSNNFSGEIPSSLSNLGQLSFLDLSYNNFSRSQFSIVNMTRLVHIFLSHNQLAGPIPFQLLPNNQLAGPIPSQLLPILEALELSHNSLNGTIPYWVFTLPSLVYLDLSHNKLTGQIHEFQYTSLEWVNLKDNELHGPIPRSIFQLVNLTFLSLSSNNLSGIVGLDKFMKLKYLGTLDLSNSRLESLSWSTYNNVTSTLPGVVQLPWKNLWYVYLHSNLLQGPLPVPPLSTVEFSISNNKLTGNIPSTFCNASLLVLDLSNNSLSGIIPKCLGNFSYLLVLDLGMNSFYGTIPEMLVKGNYLRNIYFNGNQLEGPVPQSLCNCGNLKVLNLGNNNIRDTFPDCLDTLPELQVLILRSNRFHGLIGDSKTRFPFPKMRIIDLSHNKFTGLLPTIYLQNLKAMMNMDEEYEEKTKPQYIGDGLYQDSVMVTMKGLDLELVKIQTIFTTIDLSNNKFQGHIPKIIGNINSLRVLNLSQNWLSGQIPPSLGNLTLLESLDLSSNKLDGGIPSQLTNLTFLAVLNLSYNHFVGPIPQGKQFDTFENNSYNGNMGLCGFPLSKKCGNDGAPQLPPSIEKEDDSVFAGGFGWKAVVMGYGCGTIFGLVMEFLIFLTRKPEWFVRLVEEGLHEKVKEWSKSAHRQGGRT